MGVEPRSIDAYTLHGRIRGGAAADKMDAAYTAWASDERSGLASLLIADTNSAAGGIISARSDIGTVNMPALPHYDPGELHRAVADGYASTRTTGAEAIATLVTVLRDCVLALVLGAGVPAVAHIWF